ncbi:helix-turn-helix domain-containing protein [Hazenella sp. IB182353]|uniref:helix-turn-helix domain-containing protein n=1 Tax=Polycladospora coralii TaxID=2771432 RepID=UPI001745F6D8|nr:helix-turn-helix domain-containing protein [Polycladospora coralii]MBS7530541.1 helix-turn-helix domain-containing protein [Polycladospora coralii]
MKTFHSVIRQKIGQYLRQLRDEQKLSLDQVAKLTDINRNKLNRIEHGHKVGRSDDGYLHHITQFANVLGGDIQSLGITEIDHINFKVFNTKDRTKTEYLFNSIEHKIELEHQMGINLHSMEQLDKLDFNRNSGYGIMYFYLRGLFQYHKGNYERAENELMKALNINKHYPDFQYLNMTAVCHHTISQIMYYKGDIESALEEIEKALLGYEYESKAEDAPPLQRTSTYWAILINKASYLEELKRYYECDEVINRLITHIDLMIDKYKTGVYELKAKLEYRRKHYESAVESSLLGISYALCSSHFRKYLSICNVLGNILMEVNDLDLAESSYKAVIELSSALDEQYISNTVHAYVSLGKLMFKQGEFGKAMEYYQSGTNICMEKKYSGGKYIELLVAIGDLMYRMKESQKAIQYFEEVNYIIKHKNRLKLEYVEVYFKLSMCYIGIDANKEQEYMRIYQKLKDPFHY